MFVTKKKYEELKRKYDIQVEASEVYLKEIETYKEQNKLLELTQLKEMSDTDRKYIASIADTGILKTMLENMKFQAASCNLEFVGETTDQKEYLQTGGYITGLNSVILMLDKCYKQLVAENKAKEEAAKQAVKAKPAPKK